MREIKFRAWDAKDKQMLEVNHLFNLDNEQPIEVWTNDYEGGYRFNPDKSEIMRYTGLDDINGKPIYEGDIVVVVSQYWGQLGNRYEVKFRKGAFYAEYVLLSEISPSISVIGNIHENPELLEAEK